MTATANLFNIQHFSINDGPGIRTVVFFKGCPLNCAWCHNPESKSVEKELSFLIEKCMFCQKCATICPNHVHSFENSTHRINRKNCIKCGKCVDICNYSALQILGKEYTFDEIMTKLALDDMFFADNGGVTFSGGEPFMQFDALYTLLKICKDKGYSTCIETSGFTTLERIVKAAEYTDYFLFDCKETDITNHQEFIGVDNKQILINLAALNAVNASVILRCPIIPNVNDRQEHFESIAELTQNFSCIKSVEFLPYHPLGIAKSQQLGKECPHNDPSFMDKKVIEKYYENTKELFQVPVKIN